MAHVSNTVVKHYSYQKEVPAIENWFESQLSKIKDTKTEIPNKDNFGVPEEIDTLTHFVSHN